VSLELAVEGHDLLEQKREVLFLELMQIVHRLRELDDIMIERSAAAFKALESALLSMGEESIQWVALAAIEERSIDLLHRSIMGVPVVSLNGLVRERPTVELQLQASMNNTSSALDEARRRFEELISVIYEWSEKESSVWRLATEIRKTQRRVNALENVFIPEYKQTVKGIEEVLEESDREEFIRKKKVKIVLERKRA